MVNVVRFSPPLGEPLGLDFRPGPMDHTVLLQLVSEGRTGFNGVVFDPVAAEGPHKELLEEANGRYLETVLDPKFMELATPVGFTETRAAKVPWAGTEQHTPATLSGMAGRAKAQRLADFVARLGFSSVITPCHFIYGAEDPLFPVDLRLTEELRFALDRAGAQDVTLQYPLALPGTVFANASARTAIMQALRQLPIDAVRLRVHPFGNNSGHVSLLRYVQAARALVAMDLPIIAERTGNIGLALLSFAAVSGLESGVTFGDAFNMGLLKERRASSGFAAPRVYIPELGLFVPKKAAKAMAAHSRLRSLVTCKNPACCHRGDGVIVNSRRHFVFSRIEEVSTLNRPPAQQRPGEYLERMLRPATDRLARVLQVNIEDDQLRTKLEHERDKQAGWRGTLGELAAQPVVAVPRTPTRRATRRRRAMARDQRD